MRIHDLNFKTVVRVVDIDTLTKTRVYKRGKYIVNIGDVLYVTTNPCNYGNRKYRITNESGETWFANNTWADYMEMEEVK